jgi:WD40 repeat protein
MKYSHVLLLSLVIATSLNCMEKKEQWEIIRTFNQIGNVRAVDLYKNANILATTSDDFTSHLFRCDTKKEFQSFDNNKQISQAICVESYHDLLAIGSDNGKARVIDTKSGKEKHSFENKDVIHAIKFNHACKQLAVAANHTVRVFDLVENKRLISIHHQDQPISVCFDKYDKNVITASLNKVRIFDIRSNLKIESFYRKNRYISSVLTNYDNRIITVETPGDTIQIYTKADNEITDTHIPVVTIDNGCYEIDASLNSIQRLYDGKELSSICLHPEGKMLALGLCGRALVFSQNNQK